MTQHTVLHEPGQDSLSGHAGAADWRERERTLHRLVASLPILGIAATVAAVIAADSNPALAYTVLTGGLALTALLTVLARRSLHAAADAASAQREREAALLSRNAEQERAWNALPTGLFETNRRGAWVRANPAAAALLGKSSTELLGDGWQSALAPQAAQTLAALLPQLAKSGAAWAGTLELGDANKRSIRLEVAARGDHAGLVGSLRDDSRAQALETRLRAETSHAELVHRQLEIATFDWDVAHERITLSPEWSLMRGLAETMTEVSVAELQELCHPEDCAHVQAAAIAALNGATHAYQVEHRVRDVHGHWLWIESYGRVVSRARDGSALSMLGYNARIDKRKRLESALRESERHHREVLDALHEVLFSTDAEGNWLSLNAAWGEITGHPVDESLGRSMTHYMHPENRSELKHLLRGLTEGSLAEVRHEIRLAGKDGFDRWVELRMRPTYDAEGRFDGTRGTLFDVTDRHRAEIELRRAKEGAENANRVKTDFLANVSHEIRSPLHGIVGMTDLLLDGNLDSAQREHLNHIRSSSSALLRTLNEVLDFSRIEAGKLGIELSDFDLTPVLQAATRQHAQTAARKGLSLKLKLSPEVPAGLTGDARRLEQVLDQLLDNAVKFTDRGEIELSVLLRAELSERVMLEFVVRDTGSGINADQRETLFQAFQRVRHANQPAPSGAGLGLAIAKRLAEMMGGEIWVESAPGKGSSFHFTARFYRPNPMVGRAMALPAGKAMKPAAAETAAGHAKGLKVLLVEDEPTHQKVAASMLRSLGHQVTVANNGAEAIVAWEASTPEVILMDLQMPLMGGLEATRYIRAKEAPRGAHTPIIVMTAHHDSEHQEECAAAGIDEYLAKPADKAALARSIDAAISLRQAPTRSAPIADRKTECGKILDLDAARNRLNGDDHMLGKVIAMFFERAPQVMQFCRDAIAKSDCASLANAAHTIKGMAGTIGAERMRAIASALERDARESRLPASTETFARLEAALGETISALDPARAVAPAA